MTTTPAPTGADREVRTPPRRTAGALRAYVCVMVALGLGIFAHSILTLARTPHLLEWTLLGLITVLTGSFTVKIASVPASMSVADTFFITLAVLFGPAPAAIVLVCDSFISSWRRRHAPARLAFNTVAPALSMWIAAEGFFWLARVPPLVQGNIQIQNIIFPLLGLTLIYFLLNSGLTAIAVGLDLRESPFEIWYRHFRWLSLSYLAAGSASFCLILLIHQISLSALAVILPLVIIFHLTLRSSFGRLEDAHKHLASMDRLYLSTIETLAMAIDAKDDVTHSHVRRVQTYAVALANALGIIDDATIKAIKAAALLHDTGKLAVPEHILNKPGGLTAAEFETMKLHVDVGADILSLVDFPYPVVPIVRCHHENWDGSGYPRGIHGEEIPIGARILSVVDCYDALVSDRPYRSALSDEAAIDILGSRRGTMYDPRVVDTFIAIRRDVALADLTPRQHHEALQKISQSRVTPPEPAAPPSAAGSPASDEVLAFVSLARVASGEVSVGDVLALASTLLRDLVPGATAAWYILDAAHDRLTVSDAVGPAAAAVRGLSVRVGDRLTGWVAANRQVIVNSDAALDLGPRAAAVAPPLASCMSAPLVSGQTLVGVLTLYASTRKPFTEDQGRLVQVIAPHVADAIARAERRQTADKNHLYVVPGFSRTTRSA
jgi:putative nucleotidyltransferase with HDIG domain